jgi:hypothetical protein
VGRGERVTEVIYRGTRLDYNDDENKTGVDAGKGVAKNRDEVFREMEEVFGLVPGWVRKLPDVAIGEIWALVKGAQLGETHIPAKYKILHRRGCGGSAAKPPLLLLRDGGGQVARGHGG